MNSDTPTIDQMKYAIAKFMGYEKVTVGYADSEEETEWQRNNEEWMVRVGITQVGDYAVNVSRDKWHRWEEVIYHTSWDDIIPVCKKIRSTKITGMPALMAQMKATQEMNNGLVALDLEKTHKGVYLFILWHNNQNKNQ